MNNYHPESPESPTIITSDIAFSDWIYDPQVCGVNRLPAHSSHATFASEECFLDNFRVSLDSETQ